MPKCLLEINNESIIKNQIKLLQQIGINDVIVVVGYQARKIKSHLGNNVNYIENKIFDRTNSSYSLWLAREMLKEGWLHLNGDLLFHPHILKNFEESPLSNALSVDTNIDPADDGERVQVDSTSRIIRMAKGLDLQLSFGRTIGMAKFDKTGASIILSHLDEVIKSGEKNRWFFSIISECLMNIPIYAVSTEGYSWAEVDTIEDLTKAKNIMSETTQ